MCAPEVSVLTESLCARVLNAQAISFDSALKIDPHFPIKMKISGVLTIFFSLLVLLLTCCNCEPVPCADPERGSEPPENHKNIGCPSKTGPDPLEITKLPSQHSMLCHHRPASETPFKWHFAG